MLQEEDPVTPYKDPSTKMMSKTFQNTATMQNSGATKRTQYFFENNNGTSASKTRKQGSPNNSLKRNIEEKE